MPCLGRASDTSARGANQRPRGDFSWDFTKPKMVIFHGDLLDFNGRNGGCSWDMNGIYPA